MRTLIIPCAGKSSRFPNMRPKWMLTHPDGQMMIQKAVSSQDLTAYDRVVIVIVKDHIEKYDAELVLNQAFGEINKVEICILPTFTKSASETISKAIEAMNITGSIVIKDSDNAVEFTLPNKEINAAVGMELTSDSEIRNIQAKSFLRVNDQGLILDILEKKIVSNTICLGVYIFADARQFVQSYEAMNKGDFKGEMYISHVMSFMLTEKNQPFQYITAKSYQDWGTLIEWKDVQKNMRTIFIDFDGVLIKNSGRYGKVNWDNNDEILEENCKRIRELQQAGAQIILTTSRPENFREKVEGLLMRAGIKPYAILMGLHHAPRVLVNDFAPSNPYPSATAINISRNGSLSDYI